MGDILFLAHRMPFPPDRGDKIRAFNVLRYLSQRKRVHLIAFADDPADLARKNALADLTDDCHVIWRGKSQAVAGLQAVATRRPLSLTAFDHAGVRDAVKHMLARHEIDAIYVFSSQMAQYVPAQSRQKMVMDFVDMDSAKFATYGATTGGFAGWMMRREAKLLARYEQAVAARADASLFVSTAEADLFRERTGATRVHVVENGIDTASFDPDQSFEPIDPIDKLIVFTGQMDYRPNVEGVVWFTETILPRIHAHHPDARFAIVGRKPANSVRALSSRPGVMVVGEVPDVRPWLRTAAVVVAPLMLARGVQNKVLEAMAMARPVVVSAPAATGIDHDGTIVVGDTAADFAEAINGLIADPVHAARLGATARQRVIDQFSWDAKLAALDDIMVLEPRGDASRHQWAAA